jgi:hypothetical protein
MSKDSVPLKIITFYNFSAGVFAVLHIRPTEQTRPSRLQNLTHRTIYNKKKISPAFHRTQFSGMQ